MSGQQSDGAEHPNYPGGWTPEEWNRGVMIDDWAQWRDPETQAYITSFDQPDWVAHRLRRHLEIDINVGKIVLGIPIGFGARKIPPDAVRDVIAEMYFDFFRGDEIEVDGVWRALRVYLPSRFTEADIIAQASSPSVDADVDVDKDSSRIERRGRKSPYNWEGFLVEACRRIVKLDGLPKLQAEFEREMLQWCQDTWDDEPSVSSVRKRLGPFYRVVRPDAKTDSNS